MRAELVPGLRAALWTLLGLAMASRALARSEKADPAVREALNASSRVRVIVALREPPSAVETVTSRMSEIAAVQHRVLSGLTAEDFTLTRQWKTIAGLAGDLTAEGLKKLEAHADVLRISRDLPQRASLDVSVPFIHGNDARAAGFTGKGVVVAVIDSGIDPNNPDLADNLVEEECFCSFGGGCCPNGLAQQSGPGSAQDLNGHGTNVAGIVASAGNRAPVGVAPDAQLLALKVLDAGGSGAFSDGITALDFLIANRPQVRIVNMSLGAQNRPFSNVCDDADPTYSSAVNSLRARGTVVFVASGNDAFTSAISAPACFSGATAVGAVYDGRSDAFTSFGVCSDSSNSADRVTCFSNSSALVKLLAPGGTITSSGLLGETLTESGTSQATPHAAGSAAVLLEANSGLSPDQIVSVLQATGVPVRDPRNGLPFFRINLKAALDAVPH